MNGAPAELIREALITGEYARAMELWHEYTAAIAAGALNQELLKEVGELVAWSRPFLSRVREDAAARLRMLHVASAYGTSSARQETRLRASF